jgi:hypothetical protein
MAVIIIIIIIIIIDGGGDLGRELYLTKSFVISSLYCAARIGIPLRAPP